MKICPVIPVWVKIGQYKYLHEEIQVFLEYNSCVISRYLQERKMFKKEFKDWNLADILCPKHASVSVKGFRDEQKPYCFMCHFVTPEALDSVRFWVSLHKFVKDQIWPSVKYYELLNGWTDFKFDMGKLLRIVVGQFRF
jgi:hypothetical protein